MPDVNQSPVATEEPTDAKRRQVLPALFAVLAGANDGVFVVDSDQQILYWSDRAADLTGIAAAAAVGHCCYEIMISDDDEGHAFCRRDCPTICAVRRGRGVPDYDVRSVREGEEVWFNISIVPLPAWLAGEPAAIHMFRDVTQRRRAELLAQHTLEAVQSYTSFSAPWPTPESRPFSTPAPKLTPRETDVLQLLGRGLGTDKIADRLGISVGTVRNHSDHLLRKMGAHSRLEAVTRGRELGLI